MTLVLDTGALIALERNDRAMWRRLKGALLAGDGAVTHGGVLGQAWRGRGPRQALLARALPSIEVRALGEALGLLAGELLGVTGGTDVIDAALALLAEDGDQILTSDPEDIAHLASAAGRHVDVVQV